MGKLIVFNLISLDGYACGPDGNLMALPFGETFDAYCVERLQQAGTLLLGRSTFDGFHSFWPAVQDDETATPDQREISRLDNAIDKVVVSDSLDAVTGPWGDTTRVVSRADAAQAITARKQDSPRDILVFGSLTTWHDLFAQGLVDELHLMVGSVVLGGGVPALPGPSLHYR